MIIISKSLILILQNKTTTKVSMISNLYYKLYKIINDHFIDIFYLNERLLFEANDSSYK